MYNLLSYYVVKNRKGFWKSLFKKKSGKYNFVPAVYGIICMCQRTPARKYLTVHFRSLLHWKLISIFLFIVSFLQKSVQYFSSESIFQFDELGTC